VVFDKLAREDIHAWVDAWQKMRETLPPQGG